jgi:nitrite reductase (NADH) small subunit
MIERFRVGALSQIPKGEGRTFRVGGRRIAVFHSRDGHAYATQADCPHKGGPLADGLVGGSTLVCPLHEWTFDLQSGMTMNGACGLRTYPVIGGADGALYVEVDTSRD